MELPPAEYRILFAVRLQRRDGRRRVSGIQHMLRRLVTCVGVSRRQVVSAVPYRELCVFP